MTRELATTERKAVVKHARERTLDVDIEMTPRTRLTNGGLLESQSPSPRNKANTGGKSIAYPDVHHVNNPHTAHAPSTETRHGLNR
jgi:hypothetical protein